MKNHLTAYIIATGCAMAFASFEPEAHARCVDTPASTSAGDDALQFINPCNVPVAASTTVAAQDVPVLLGYFDMQQDDWETPPNGFTPSFNERNDGCNQPPIVFPNTLTGEQSKIFSAEYMHVWGVDFTRFPPNVPVLVPSASSFHGGGPLGDYSNLVNESSGVWHGWFRHQVDDVIIINGLPSPNTVALYQPRVFPPGIPDLIEGACALYDSPSTFGTGRLPTADPAFRASTLVHEAWHAWENQAGLSINNTTCGHSLCPGDGHATNNSCWGAECDIWYPHPIGECPTGANIPTSLFSSVPVAIQGCNNALTNGDPTYDLGNMYAIMHRPYQAQTEFSCDIANTPAGWVPLIIRELSASNADFYETHDSVTAAGVTALLNAGAAVPTTSPRPFLGSTGAAVQPACYAIDFGVQYPICGGQRCSNTNPCPGNEFCNNRGVCQGTQCDEANPCQFAENLCNPQTGCCQLAIGQCTELFSVSCTSPGDAGSPCPTTCNFATNCCPPQPPPK